MEGQPPAARANSQLKCLQALYTEHVVPNEMIQLWGADEESMDADLERVKQDRVAFVLTKLLQGDNHPTLTRFFTFRACVDRMLTMALLKFPQNGLKPKATARETAQKRMTKVKHFLPNQRLARRCVATAWFCN